MSYTFGKLSRNPNIGLCPRTRVCSTYDVLHEINNEILFKSPNGKHSLKLIYEFEIRFGPAYYTAELNGNKIKKTIFGNKCLWSTNSRYIALEKWESTSERKGPDTRLYIIDVEFLMYYSKPRAKGGFFEFLSFDGDVIIYKKVFYAGIAREEEFEISIGDIKNWEKIKFA